MPIVTFNPLTKTCSVQFSNPEQTVGIVTIEGACLALHQMGYERWIVINKEVSHGDTCY